MPGAWSRFVKRYVDLAFRRPGALLAALAVLTGLCATVAASRLRVVTDLATLLPEGTPSVKALDESKARIGSTDFYTIAIESPSRDGRAIAELQDRLREHILRDWTDAEWVQIDRDTRFFREHALYYLPESELERLLAALDDELLRATAGRVPGLVLLDETLEGSGLAGWYDEDLPRELGLPPQVVEEFGSFFRPRDPGTSAADELRRGRRLASRLIGPDSDVGVVLVQLARPSTDLDYARSALARGEALIATLDPGGRAPGLRAQVVGAYRSFKEVGAVARDGRVATAVSVTLVVLLLFLCFRSPRTVVAVVLPLILAAALTMAVTALTYGRLTVLTVFVLAMLAGLGIDYGIHLFGRILQEVRDGAEVTAATVAALRRTGRALLAAALTTIAALLTLLLGHFEGFREFAVVASYGLVLCVASTLAAVPPLVALMERIRPLRRRPADATPAPPADRLLGAPVRRLARTACLGVAVLTLALLAFAPAVRFEYDFRNLRAPSTGATIGYGRAIGKASSTTPAVILGRSRAQMRQVHEFLRHKLVVERDPTLKSFITLYTFVPPAEDQAARQELIEEIGELVHKKAFDRATGETGRLVTELRRMTAAAPFDASALPAWARMIVTERDGTVGRIGHLYARVKDWHAQSVIAFQEAYGLLEFNGEWLPIANSRFILADVVKMVQADGVRLLVVASIALVLILLVYTRSLKGSLLLAGVLVPAALITVGLMGALDIRIGLYNLIVIPVILGVGLDAAIHLYHRHQELGPAGLARNLRTTGLAVTASAWTTIAGFTGLLFVAHRGLRTIGVLAVLGVAVSWLTVVLALPYLLLLGDLTSARCRGSKAQPAR